MRYAPRRRKPVRRRGWLGLVVLGGPLLCFAGSLFHSSALIQAPGFVEQEQLTVRASSQGQVDEVYVKALDQVAAGQPLARLSNSMLQARAEELRAELKQLQDVAARVGPRSGAKGAGVPGRILANQAELSDIERQQQALVVRAPQAGRLIDLAVVEGDQMAAGGEVAMLAPLGGEMHIDAYIPPMRAFYAQPGTRAAVIFPDGTRRSTVVAYLAQIAAEVPKARRALLGKSELGVLVRMQFLDAGNEAQRPPTDGLPVKVEFENGWSLDDPRKLAGQMEQAWTDLVASISPSSNM